MNRTAWRVVKFLVITLLAFIGAWFLPILQVLLWSTVVAASVTWQVSLDLMWWGLLAIIFAGLLAPLEALGWWAGWYGDEIDTALNPGTLAEPFPTDRHVTRYVIYLDGISQAQYEYLPEVERFLDELAIALPDDIVLIKGIMPYSVLNRPLTENALLGWFWRIADRYQMNASGGIIGALIGATINIRNVLIVSVVADQRYGPIYNQGVAQVIYNSLINHHYQPDSNIPITLLGYSGGAQMALGAASYLKRALRAPIEVISLAGVISGNHNFLELEHLYHIVGDKDLVEKEGPILFPRRWKIFPLSYWNRAKRRGKISFISLGPVGHNAAQGPYGATAGLPDGRTHLQQTVELLSNLIQGRSPLSRRLNWSKASNYDRYVLAPFNQPDYYPLDQTVDREWYRAIAPWMGRLILPKAEQRRYVNGAWFEVHHAPSEHEQLIGRIVALRWSHDSEVQARIRLVTKDLYFSEDAEYSQQQGVVHPLRIDRWRQVDPLESLAGSHPIDDVIVKLDGTVEVCGDQPPTPNPYLLISREPIQITGRYYALVKVLHALPDASVPDCFQIVHFARRTGAFTGLQEVIQIPQVVADMHDCYPSSNRDMERSPVNETGWYIYGAKDATGLFVVQAIAPRALLRLQPDEVILGRKPSWHYLKRQAWKIEGQKGRTRSVLLNPAGDQADREAQATREKGTSFPTTYTPPPPVDAQLLNDWKEGDRSLLIHVYGGIGGKKREPAAKTPIFFGHFAYGVAQVVREPLADELMFDITYYQVYTHNVDGVIAGKLAWQKFMGDRQFGWLGTRPVADLLIRLDTFTYDYDIREGYQSALDDLLHQLEAMAARYRIGDGTGGTYVGAAHNCAQDSNQALYAALKHIRDRVEGNEALIASLKNDPEQAQLFEQLVNLTRQIRWELLPFGSARADWQNSENTLGISPEEDFFQGLFIGLRSWRTLLPRLASEAIAYQFLEQGAQIWILRTNQVGGDDPDIEPIAPTPIG